MNGSETPKRSLLEGAMRLGVICGFTTVHEAVLNAERSAYMVMPHAELPAYVGKLQDEFNAWTGGDEIPEHIVKEENDRLERYFEENP